MVDGRPEVSIIIVNYNGKKWLPLCLAAATSQDGVASEVILVDNGSSDGSGEWARASYPAITVLLLDRNEGFAGANNAGARVARGRCLAFLNNDAVPMPGWAAALHAALHRDPRVVLSTSKIVFLHESSIVDSAGDGYLHAGGAFKRLHGGPASDATESCEVFGVCGAACMITSEVFAELGGFDEDFFMVYEDVDLSYRARLLGYRCWYVAEALVRHVGSGTLGRASAGAVFFGQRNLEWTYVKNTPWPLLVRSLPSHVLYDAAAGIRYAVAGRFPSYLRGKLAALRGLPAILSKRVTVQRTRRATSKAIWRMMDGRWIRIKHREKRFDLAARDR